MSDIGSPPPPETLRSALAAIAAELQPRPPRNALVRLADLLHRRALSRTTFGIPIATDSAWLMLLALVIAEDDGVAPSVLQLCARSGAPATTAFRCLLRLEDLGLVVRAPDPRDRRRVLVTLTSTGREAIIGALAALHAEVMDFALG